MRSGMTRRTAIKTAALATTALIAAPYVRGAHAAGKLSIGFWDHWVPGANTTCTALIDDTSPWAEVQKVTYYLATPTNNATGRDLIRSISRNPIPLNTTDEPEQQWLMGGIDRMALQFYDGRAWTETWDSTLTTNLPMAIKVQIALTGQNSRRSLLAPIEFIVPVMVQPRTNTTATGGGA